MAQPYTVRFGQTARTAQGAIPIYVAPPGLTSILRDVIVWNRATTAGTLAVWIQTPGGNVFIIGWTDSAGPSSGLRFDGRQVILENEQLFVYGTTNNWTAIATGYELSSP